MTRLRRAWREDGLRSAALGIVLLLAACEFSADQITPNETAAATGNQPVLAPPVPPPPPQPAAAKPELAVEAEGLRLIDEKTGTGRALPFGMEKAALLAILEGFRGPADGGTNSECGAGPLEHAVWADGLTLWIQDGKFAGWALDRRAGDAHETVAGIGIGSTRKQLEAAHEVKIEETTLGTEFGAGGLSGILDGTGPDAKIEAMWAGVSCVFR